MSGFKLSSELLIGGSSDLDAVFLPVSVDSHNAMTCDLGPPSWEGGVTVREQQQHLYHNNHNHHNHHNNNNNSNNNHNHNSSNSHNNHVGNHHHVTTHNNHHIISSGGQKTPETKILLEHTDDAGEEEDIEDGKETGSSILVNAIITNQPDSNDWCYRTSLTSIGVIIVIILFIVFGFDYVRQLLVWLEGVEPWKSILVLMALFCLISFPMAWGLSLLMVVCGYLYGILYGPLVVALNMTVCLATSRTVMQSMCASSLRARFFSPKVEAMVNVVSGKHGMKVVALARLTPIPFGLQNALFSLSSMSLPRYLISSVGGFIPMNVLHCYLGSTLRTMQDIVSYDSNHLVGYSIFGGQILLTIVLLWFVIRKARVELKKAMDESDKSSLDLPNGDCSKTVFVNGHDGL